MFKRKIKIYRKKKLFTKTHEKTHNLGFFHNFLFFPVKREESLLRSEICYMKNQLIALENNFLPPENIID